MRLMFSLHNCHRIIVCHFTRNDNLFDAKSNCTRTKSQHITSHPAAASKKNYYLLCETSIRFYLKILNSTNNRIGYFFTKNANKMSDTWNHTQLYSILRLHCMQNWGREQKSNMGEKMWTKSIMGKPTVHYVHSSSPSFSFRSSIQTQ